MSCGQTSREESLREQIDRIKKNDLPNMDFAVSAYVVDSSAHWNIIFEIIQRQKSGIETTTINTEFRQNNKLVKTVSNNLNQKSFKKDGSYGYRSNFEEFESIFSDVEGHFKAFGLGKYPVTLLCEQ